MSKPTKEHPPKWIRCDPDGTNAVVVGHGWPYIIQTADVGKLLLLRPADAVPPYLKETDQT